MAVAETSPSGRSLPTVPPSPSKTDSALRQNPHPYAIRTTSTALLSRSNSTGFNTNATRHYYVPLSPSPRSNARTHRASKSQPPDLDIMNKAPQPLPVPVTFPPASPTKGYVSADETFVPRRLKRADTLPSYSTYTPPTVSMTLEDLPSNPKLWSPSQLSNYLVTALRVTASKSGDIAEIALPARVANDIATFVRDVRMTGRTFLRLNEEDLAAMNLNRKWREALLIASRNLRQNVLKGRIWGADTDGPTSPGSASPTMPAHPFSSTLYNSSSSSLDLVSEKEEDDVGKRPRHYRNGRVRGMVESFERSGSFSSESSFDEGVTRPDLDRWLHEEGAIQDNAVQLSPTVETNRPLPTPPPSTIADEPSIEDLLASEDQSMELGHSWGARAWEELDLAPGVTVKRVRDPSGGSDNSSTLASMQGDDVFPTIGKGSGRSSNGSSTGKGGREERRIVTAIFRPPVPDSGEADKLKQDSAAIPQVKDEQVQVFDLAKSLETIEQTLLAQVTENRNLLEQFRSRLEAVEHNVDTLEKQSAELEKEQEQKPQIMVPDNVTQSSTSIASRQGNTSAPPEAPTSTSPTQSASFIPSASSGPSTPKEPKSTDNRGRTSDPGCEDSPSSISELPTYVLLVGLGVCAVVLRVMLRKVGGRTSLGWKP